MALQRALMILGLAAVMGACGSGTGSIGGSGSDAGGGGDGGGGGGGNGTAEVCSNGTDDDGDGFADCADTECFQAQGCFTECLDLCFPGSSLCENDGVRSCEKLSDGCYAFGATKACDPSLVCSVGACAETCTNACTEGAKACSGGGVVTCTKLSSGCTEWVAPTACPSGEICSGGACVQKGSCTNQCAEGATRCTAGGQQQTCVKAATGCSEWALPQSCPGEQTCPSTGNACLQVPCTTGDTRCKGTVVETCNAQAMWIETQSCPQACSAGACTATVACTPGAVRCNQASVEICNSSGTAWLFNQTCNVGCSAGVCTDPCTEGAKRCNGNSTEICNMGGTGWTATQSCTNGCYQGDCIQADLVVDGVSQTLEGDLVLSNSLVVRNGGQIVVGPSGRLKIQAKTVSIDGASSLVANAVGDDTRGVPNNDGKVCCSKQYCSGGYKTPCSSSTVGATYGASINVTESINYGCSYYTYTCTASGSAPAYDRDDDLSISEGTKMGTDPGGGLVSIIAEAVTVDGDLTANGTGRASGGGILIAADTISGNKVIQAAGGASSGGVGRVKLLRGSTNAFTGTVIGKKSDSVMPPLTLVSGTHPDSTRWYNDGLGEWALAWSRPFPTVNGYYYRVSTDPHTLPSPSNGTFMQGELFTVKAEDLKPGANYFHIVSVDSGFTVGTVQNFFKTNINTNPPTIASQSHTQKSWSSNVSPYFTWTNPKSDDNFTGYYYVLDRYADTVPSATSGTFTSQKQLLLSNLQPGIWVLHLVNRDTRGATTKAAQHFVLYLGEAPAKWNVSGSVYDGTDNNAPLANVTLQVNRGLFSTTTATNGTYTFNNNLYVGTWELTASAEGYQPQTKTVTLVEGQPLNVNFTLTK